MLCMHGSVIHLFPFSDHSGPPSKIHCSGVTMADRFSAGPLYPEHCSQVEDAQDNGSERRSFAFSEFIFMLQCFEAPKQKPQVLLAVVTCYQEPSEPQTPVMLSVCSREVSRKVSVCRNNFLKS